MSCSLPTSTSLVHLALGLVMALVMAFMGACDAEVQGPTGGAKCSLDAPCDDGLVCQDGSCREPCTEDTSSCSDGMCDLGSGLCVECLSNEDCGSERVCNSFTGRCVNASPGCTSNADCSGLICDLTKGACIECQNDADCGLGASCDLLSNTCGLETACVNDGDCGTNLVCEPGERVCVECFSDAHCAAGNCDDATHTCPAGCIDDDASEPNNGDGAVILADGGEHQGRICTEDLDEFSVQVTEASTRLVATVNVEGALLSLRLLSASGSLVANAVDDGNGGLRLEAPSLQAGFYLLSLAGALHDEEGDYLLHVDITAPTQCADIDTEPNDTTATASAVPVDGTLRSGSICGADTDLWRFTATEGDDIDVSVIPGEGDGSLDADLLNSGGSVIASGLDIAEADVAAGTYYVRVTADDDVTYSLRVTSTAEPPVCAQRDAEPNDADAQALALAPGAVITGTICAGDTDQHRFAATGLDDVRVTITGANVTARLVRASDGAQIGTGTNIVANDVQAGGYRVVVAGSNGTVEGDYTVRVDLTAEPVPDPCEEGGLEPDDTAGNERALALDGTQQAGRICAADTDFYTFELDFDSTVTVTARFTHAQGDLDMRLYDSGGAVLRSATGVSNNEVLTLPLGPGTYTVRIFGYNGALNTYTIDATLVGCSPEDGFEDNNAVERATPLAPTTLDAVRCPGDDDFFAVRLESGDALSATLAPTGGPLTMSLVSATGQLLVSDAAGAGSARTLAANGLPPGRYLVRVTGTSAERVTYALTTAVTASPARCVDDGASPNETAAAAFALDDIGLADGSFDVGSLVTCAVGDADWFAIDLPADRMVTVQLAFPPASDVDVEVLEPRGTSAFTRTLARSYATDTQDRVTGMINQSGRYWVKAIGYRTGAVPYAIGVEVASPPSTPCLDDRFDTWSATANNGATTPKNNDTAIDAVELSAPETFTAMHACPNDGDWHKLAVPAGGTLSVHVTYTHAVGRDIDVRVYGPAQQTTPLATCTQASNTTGTALTCTSAGVDGSEDLRLTSADGGNHYIEVFGYSGGEAAYDLAVTLQ